MPRSWGGCLRAAGVKWFIWRHLSRGKTKRSKRARDLAVVSKASQKNAQFSEDPGNKQELVIVKYIVQGSFFGSLVTTEVYCLSKLGLESFRLS